MDALTRPPTLFLSHGSPMLAVQDSPAGRFLDGLGEALPRPRAIVVASAHFTAARPAVGADPQPRTVHDFGAFADELFRIRYPAPGDPGLAGHVAGLLGDAGLPAQLLPSHGLDHGVWVPLLRMYPQADIAVVPLAVMPHGDAAGHYALGRALAELRDDGVLVIGSGGFVHNLGEVDWRGDATTLVPWAEEFAEWLCRGLDAGDIAALLDWQHRAPHARRAHPTVEHLMPMFVALGAAGEGAMVRQLHRSHELGSLALDAFAFG